MLAVTLLISGCAPTLAMQAGPQTDRLRAMAQAFCETTDPDVRIGLFSPRIQARLQQTRDSGTPLFASRADSGTCRVGAALYRGGSLDLVAVHYRGHTDHLLFWKADQGQISDIEYGRGGTLRERLGRLEQP